MTSLSSKDINIIFIHPTDGRALRVEMDASMTAKEVIAELVAVNFIPSSIERYSLAIKGGNIISESKTFSQESIEEGAIIRIIPNTDAG